MILLVCNQGGIYMLVKGYNYQIDSSLLVTKLYDGTIKPICIFAKTQKDLKTYIKVLKEHGDTGTLKVQERFVRHQHIPEDGTYEHFCELQLKEMERILKENERNL
jgi:hypothetical protein